MDDGVPENPYRWVKTEDIRDLEESLLAAKRWNWALTIFAGCALLYAAVADYQWKQTKNFAQRSNAIGYLEAQTDMLTGQFSTPSVNQVNAAIREWQAKSKELGYVNPDTLRYYKIKPWEDYEEEVRTWVANRSNFTKRHKR